VTHTPPSVLVTVQGEVGADDEETAVLAERLRAALVDSEFDLGSAPPALVPGAGAKVVDPVSISVIVVALAASGGALTSLVQAAQAWLLRSSARRVVLEIDGDRLELDGVTSEERRRLTTEWLDRHPSRGDRDSGGDRDRADDSA
jgi:hypothetical protein